MRRRSLTQLADNPDLIDGIYNYCDRWCERCPFTSRCLVYATEADEEVSLKEQDVANASFCEAEEIAAHVLTRASRRGAAAGS